MESGPRGGARPPWLMQLMWPERRGEAEPGPSFTHAGGGSAAPPCPGGTAPAGGRDGAAHSALGGVGWDWWE